uniref:Four helix bundle protein n=1 Tax=Schlesneria paludicola TaxID=360056 RepID=A0A7C2K010_9PLAN
MTEPSQAVPDRSERKFDLEERTAQFGESVVFVAKSFEITPVTRSLIDQIVRSATSIGANYCEADDAPTKKSFRNSISICKKEARETKHWLRMLAAAVPERKADLRRLWDEARQLHLIFAAIHRRQPGDSSSSDKSR